MHLWLQYAPGKFPAMHTKSYSSKNNANLVLFEWERIK